MDQWPRWWHGLSWQPNICTKCDWSWKSNLARKNVEKEELVGEVGKVADDLPLKEKGKMTAEDQNQCLSSQLIQLGEGLVRQIILRIYMWFKRKKINPDWCLCLRRGVGRLPPCQLQGWKRWVLFPFLVALVA